MRFEDLYTRLGIGSNRYVGWVHLELFLIVRTSSMNQRMEQVFFLIMHNFFLLGKLFAVNKVQFPKLHVVLLLINRETIFLRKQSLLSIKIVLDFVSSYLIIH